MITILMFSLCLIFVFCSALGRHGGKPVTISSMSVAQGDDQKELVRKLDCCCLWLLSSLCYCWILNVCCTTVRLTSYIV